MSPSISVVSEKPHSHDGVQLIPDLLANWPWPRAVNPLYDDVSIEANQWFKSFQLFTPKSQRAFDRGDNRQNSGYGCTPRLTSCMDFANVAFSVDEYTDKQPPSIVRDIADGCIAVMQNRTFEDKGRGLNEFFSQFWKGAMKVATPQSAKQLASTLTDYLNGTHREAESVVTGDFLDYERYLQIRLESIGVRMFYAMCGLPLSIPDVVFEDPLFVELQYLGSELVLLDNDIISYNRERAMSMAEFNSITIIMAQFGLSYADAVGWLVGRIAQLENRYMEIHEYFESRAFNDGMVRKDVLQLLDLMGNLRAANYYWSFESGRYFGTLGEETRKTHQCPMAPIQPRNWDLRGEQVEVLLMDDALERTGSEGVVRLIPPGAAAP